MKTEYRIVKRIVHLQAKNHNMIKGFIPEIEKHEIFDIQSRTVTSILWFWELASEWNTEFSCFSSLAQAEAHLSFILLKDIEEVVKTIK